MTYNYIETLERIFFETHPIKVHTSLTTNQTFSLRAV